MGKRASRVGRDAAQGIILGPGARSVLINNAPASLVNDRIAPHGQSPHTSSRVLTGSRTVFAESRSLTVQTSTTICGHLVSSGSDNVFADDPGGTGSGGGGGRGLNIPLRDTTNVFDGVFIPPDPYTFEHARAVITAAGNDAVADEEIETSFRESVTASFPPETRPSLDPEASTNSDTPAPAPPSEIPGCEDVAAPPVDYTTALSSSYVLRNLSTGAVFPHNIVAQLGLAEDEIICNLRALSENILEPLRVQYPGFNINSGFRRGSAGSQHNRGQAVDVQWPGLPAGAYTERALWIRDNLPYDQFILEHGRSIWFHLSFNRSLGSSQRRQVLTYHPQTSPQYQAGITNYYA
jgi:uncharacterized Zn-binding protein involved in type VI secretion